MSHLRHSLLHVLKPPLLQPGILKTPIHPKVPQRSPTSCAPGTPEFSASSVIYNDTARARQGVWLAL